MLQVDVDALGLDALHLSSADGASHERVLRVVLEVTAGVSGAVHIDAGAVQAGVTHGQAVLADAPADLVDEVNIEGGSHDILGGVAHCGCTTGQGSGQTLRAVLVLGSSLADGGSGCGVVEAEGDGLDHLAVGQLVQQGIPLGIIKVLADHGSEGQAVLGAQSGHLDAVGLRAVVLGEGEARSQSLVGGQLCGSGGDGAGPVGAAHPGHTAGGVAALVGVGLVKQVGDGGAGCAGGEGGGVESVVGPLPDEVGAAVLGHAAIGVLDGVALGSQDVVDCVVGIGGSGEVVVTGVHDVGLGVVRVVGAQLALRDRDGHVLRSAGRQHVGLCEAAQLSSSLLDAVCLVVSGVGRLEVDLDGLLAGEGLAGVGDLQGDGEGIVRLGHIEVGVCEGGVAVAVAEGVSNGGRPVVIASLGGTHDDILVTGLEVTVAQIDAFLIDTVHTLHVSTLGQQVVLCCVGVSLGVEVVHSRVCHVVVQIGIDQRAGGGDSAGQQLAHTVDAGLAHVADPHSSVDAVVLTADLGVEEVQLDGVGAVDENDDVLEGAVVLQSLQVLQQLDLFSGQSEVVAVALLTGDPAVAGAILAAGKVCALTAGAGEDHDGSVAVLSKAGLSAGQSAPGSLVDSVLGVCLQSIGDGSGGHAAVLAHHGVRAVQVPQGLVDGDALSFQSLLEAGSLAGIDRAGAGAAVHQVHRAVAEQADLSAAGQRQGIVLVLQQSRALGLDRRAQFGLVSLALLIGSKALLEVFGIAGILAVDDLIGRCIQSDVDGGSVLVCDDVAHDGSDGQDRRQAGENRPQPYFRFGVFHGFSSFFL